jgi:hypothetical protein
VAKEGAPVAETGLRAEEVQLAGGLQLEQPGQEQPSKQLAEDPHRQQEGRPRRDPALAVEREAAARHDHVDVRMVRHRRPPGVEHGGDADARAEVARVGGDGQHGLRRGLEQQIVDRRLVGERNGGDLGGHGEDDMEVPNRQQVGLARGEPFARRRSLALGAVPVPAAVVGDAGVAAVLAALDVSAQRGGATGLDGRHHLELGEVDVPGVHRPPGRSMPAEDVGDFQRGSHGRLQPPGL